MGSKQTRTQIDERTDTRMGTRADAQQTGKRTGGYIRKTLGMWTEEQQRETLRRLKGLGKEGLWWRVLLALKVRWGLADTQVAGMTWAKLAGVTGERGEDRGAWWWLALDEWREELDQYGERGDGWPYVCKEWDRGIWRRIGVVALTRSRNRLVEVMRGVPGLETLNWYGVGKWHWEWRDANKLRRRIWSGARQKRQPRRRVMEIKGSGVDWAKVREWWGDRYSAGHEREKSWPELDPEYRDLEREEMDRLSKIRKAKVERLRNGVKYQKGRPRTQERREPMKRGRKQGKTDPWLP